MKLRAADADEAEALAAVHAQAFDHPWPAAEIATLSVGLGGFAVAADDEAGALVGFAIGRAMAGEAEVLTLAVAPNARRGGVGRGLVESLAALAAARGAAKLFLEVAADNAAAIALYQAAGFTQVGVRRNYYRRADAAPADALVMSRALNS